MADETVHTGEVFDIEKLKQLIELMKENELSEIDLKEAENRIRLRRGGDAQPTYVAPAPQYQVPAAAPVAAPAAAAPVAPAAESNANIEFIESPMVGTFYAKPNPESEAYVKVGDVVTADTIVCQVEAMKMFNELPAGKAGKIVAVLVNNEDPVDVNKALFKIDTSAS